MSKTFEDLAQTARKWKSEIRTAQLAVYQNSTELARRSDLLSVGPSAQIEFALIVTALLSEEGLFQWRVMCDDAELTNNMEVMEEFVKAAIPDPPAGSLTKDQVEAVLLAKFEAGGLTLEKLYELDNRAWPPSHLVTLHTVVRVAAVCPLLARLLGGMAPVFAEGLVGSLEHLVLAAPLPAGLPAAVVGPKLEKAFARSSGARRGARRSGRRWRATTRRSRRSWAGSRR